jgi:ectoine hydroxylase-related dioxygenase (phytanoyl-CoA dioxygenase family)
MDMQVQRLSNTATVDEATEVVREHGHVVIDELVAAGVMARLVEEMQPYIDESPYGENEGFGRKTRRTGRLIARSATARDLVMHPLTLGVARSFLSNATAVQLAATEMISLDPGEAAQFLHRDDMIADNYPFPLDFPIYCNSLWAVTDCTEENGATRVVPGSHTKSFTSTEYTQEDSVAAEMTCGSVLIFSGKLVHGAGANRSSAIRRTLGLPCSLSWIRQEENQYLACPPEVARTLPEALLRLMGYEIVNGYGHAGGQTDPLSVLARA